MNVSNGPVGTLTNLHHIKPRFDKRTATDVKSQSQGACSSVAFGQGISTCVCVCMI